MIAHRNNVMRAQNKGKEVGKGEALKYSAAVFSFKGIRNINVVGRAGNKNGRKPFIFLLSYGNIKLKAIKARGV